MRNENKNQRYLPIEDYGIIGNLQTVGLISLFASLDYMSFPRFDSPTVFCKLLDSERGGFFSISPQMQNMVSKQMFLPDTNVLVTRFFSDEGIVEVIDYMPIETDELNCAVVRKIAVVRGKINFKVTCAPRYGYANIGHRIEQRGRGVIFIPENSQPALLLESEQHLSCDDTDATSTFLLNEGETTCFILKALNQEYPAEISVTEFVDKTYQSTINYWQNWIAQSKYDGNWKEVVHRSALTLKLLISQRYGSMIAAPTFSLPESIGKERNWDYRYTWIRDAAFTMHTFLQLGFSAEAEHFLEWIQARSSQTDLQLMFAIDGNTRLDEYFLDYMEGYKGSKPVRIGNDAHKQTQMDIYGELLETIYIFAKHGGDLTYDYWKIIIGYVEYVIGNWEKPDHSIWEVRGEKREFLFSRIMCWVAIDRAMKIGDMFSFPYDLIKWHNTRNAIYKDVYENFWNEEKKAFVQFKGSDLLDASVLLMPIFNMISPTSKKWQCTMNAIDQELRTDVLVYRYLEHDGIEIDELKSQEGTFTICSFWYVECLALAGEKEKAREYFEKMLGYANHLGLYAEQLGVKGEHLGNFPQAFTHLGLISAAIELSKKNTAAHYIHSDNTMK